MDVEEYLVQDALVHAIARAVHKRAPARFVHQAIEPLKQGGTYRYGLRVHPLHDTPTVRSAKDAPRSSYEIWRRWEDCLYLQELLEDEYGKLVKGQKSHRMKKTATGQRSESNISLANHMSDVHSYLPRLSKKGTLFKPSAATIAQRSSEYHALVNALLGDDLPPALCELRDDRLVHDFFGYWRQDLDLAKKTRAPVPADEPLGRKDTVMSILDARRPINCLDSADSSSNGTPSLTSGLSSDVPCCAPLPTPNTERWSEAIRKATYPPGYINGLIQQEQSPDVDRSRDTRVRKTNDLAVYVQTNHEVFPDHDPEMHLEPTYGTIPSTAVTRDRLVALTADTIDTLTTAQIPSSWAPLRPRARSASTSQSPGDVSQHVPGIQAVPSPGTPDARIMVLPASGVQALLPSGPSTGLRVPPVMLHRRAMTANAQDRQTSVFGKIHSGDTSGGFSDDYLMVSAEERPMSYTSLDNGSQITSDISSAQIAHGIAGKVSKSPPQIVWLQRQPMAPVDAPLHSDLSSPVEPIPEEFWDSSSSSSDEHVNLPQATRDIHKSQLDAYLEMDVSQRWWRTKPDFQELTHDDIETGVEAAYAQSTFPPSTEPQPMPVLLTTAAPLPTSLSSMSDLSRERKAMQPSTKPHCHLTPVILTTAHPPANVTDLSLGCIPSSRAANGQPGVVRSPSITAYAYSIERLRRSDPRHIKHWATYVPMGIQENEFA